MNGRLAILCAAAIAGALPLATQTHTRAPRSVFGVYGRTADGHDSIRITQKSNGKIGVAIKLYYALGHTCQLNKDGEWRKDHVAVVADGLDPDKPCQLNAYFDKNRVVLKDEGFRCTPVYCGTRGRLDEVSLFKASAAHK